MKTAIVSDSLAQLTQEQKQNLACPVELVPTNVKFEGKIYRDGVDLTPSQAYEFLEKNPEDWATSAPSPGDFLAAYKKLAAQGITEIICLTVSKSLSATWNSARMAKQLAEKELPEVKIEVIDSSTVMVGETLLILKLSQAIGQGKDFTELIKLTEQLKEKIRVYIGMETIRYLYRSGRIPEVASKIGSILPLKPVLSVHGGKLHLVTATISKDKSRQKILDIIKKELDQNYPEVGLMYLDNLEEVKVIEKEISQHYPSTKISVGEFSPIIGYALGKGTYGLGFFAK